MLKIFQYIFIIIFKKRKHYGYKYLSKLIGSIKYNIIWKSLTNTLSILSDVTFFPMIVSYKEINKHNNKPLGLKIFQVLNILNH